ncbi:MAG: proline/glycine betaine ABC transporter permease [Rhizobiaceae bacterium]|nr:proline/glycine betaine ABC transporter permease [Rhizobiaceae bacterium]
MADQAVSMADTGKASQQRTLLNAFLGGPLWAAHHGMWGLLAACAIVEVIGLVVLLRGIFAAEGSSGANFWLGLVVIVVARSLTAVAGALSVARGERHRVDAGVNTGTTTLIGLAILVFGYGLTIYRFVAPAPADFLMKFPAPRGLDTSTAQVFDDAVTWMKRNWVDFFDGLTAILRIVLNFLEVVFVSTPWPVVALVALLLAFWLSGWRAMLFTAACLAYLGLFGFWEKSMGTLALIATSVIICVLFGLPLGILAAKSRKAMTVLEPVLDVMQTLPTFVYLIPAVAFFSIGKPPGVIATVIFALPPIVRLTALGIRQVPKNVKEAAEAFGASPLQMLLKVELPLAVPSIRLGINQTIMMCLSMVVVAAMIGAGGLGLDVIRSLQMLKTGQGFLAGIAIVVCAMMLDRMIRGRARRPTHTDP